ncbi:hypothetical protein [Roseibium sp.]|uniref:hypothetical protein n=1 Tax=Roseibium sp. TaxID=1936156 RepID=UPI003B50C659
MHSAILTGHTHQGMMEIWVVKMACQGLDCGKIKEIWAFFQGKLPLRENQPAITRKTPFCLTRS